MVVTKIAVTHIGIDYGKVDVTYAEGGTAEFEVDKSLAEALQAYLEPKDQDEASHTS